jgi:hypothetical protein
MDKTVFKVYWTMTNGQANSQDCVNLRQALSCVELHRRQGMGFVTMVCENVEQVGENGVDEVKDGILPDGEAYTWSKEHRAGATRGTAHSIIDNKSNG